MALREAVSATELAQGPAALAYEDIVAGYHGNQVLHGVSVEVRQGEVVLILGPNGAGKSTLLSVGSGLVKPRSGRVLLGGEDVSSQPPHKRARAGIAHVPEGRRIFPKQSVHDNLLLGTLASRERQAVDQSFEWVYRLFPVLERKRRNDASTLSGGEQQMLAIAQAAMSRPRVLLLDEPSAGLAPILAKQVFEQTSLLRELGIAILMVEQMTGALSIADRVYVLRNGEVIDSGTPESISQQNLGSEYLGSSRDQREARSQG